MKSALLLLATGLVGSALIAAPLSGCAEASSDIPLGGETALDQRDDTSASLPAPTGGGSKDAAAASTSSSSGSTSSSSSSTSSSGGSTSSSGGSGSGGVPACPWAGDFQKMIEKASEIEAQAPCDSSCNPTTHCCFDLFGGGGSSGFPGDDAGGGGGGSGACVSN